MLHLARLSLGIYGFMLTELSRYEDCKVMASYLFRKCMPISHSSCFIPRYECGLIMNLGENVVIFELAEIAKISAKKMTFYECHLLFAAFKSTQGGKVETRLAFSVLLIHGYCNTLNKENLNRRTAPMSQHSI